MRLHEASDPADAVRRYLRLGYLLTGVLVFGLGGWAFATEIAGAVVASGRIVVETHVKKVQHPSGGVISAIAVREGQKVNAGDILLKLDPTVPRANLTIIENSLDQLATRETRLIAERDGLDAGALPARFRDSPLDEGRAALVAREERLFALRKAARDGQVAQLKERIKQLENEILGQNEQRQAKESEIALIKTELTGVRDLYAKNLLPVTRVNALERDAARLAGERGLLMSATASAAGKVNEINLQILQIEQDLRSEVARELRELQDKTAELVERGITARDQLARVDLRAPQDGIVHDLSVFTVGGVVTPGEAIMSIVPDSDAMAVDVQISPREVSHLHPDQRVFVRIAAFNQRTTPELEGELVRIGADVTRDERSGMSFYTARIRLGADAQARLGHHKLVSGMPVEAFIQTGDRSVISYLTSPLADQIRRAFRES
ncbi:HlyD family type I secretion periplasmic adaptor subunit [Bosea sp. ASV33]|uniref:HlyD family type I secretion periplasmic adaptor subunit n=1 Tax=Bosea sp. ASV33 TaxID=2795106 RepID=UPI0018EA6EB9|nr:HlyD family type I secretion periplasmic adaptor subunit [Bosea sp. ASV33]